MRKIFFVTIALLFLVPPWAFGDIIVFKSGTAKLGIIEEETPTTVKLRVKDVVVGVARSNIERIEYATPEENRELELKWAQERKEMEEEREKRRAERERQEAEQKAKGMVNVGGEWLTPAQAEAARQQTIRQQIQAQQQQASSKAPAEEAPEEELPPEIQRLPEELRNQYLENRRREKEIKVSQIVVESQGLGKSVIRGTVRNGSDAFAASVDLVISVYGEEEVPILSQSAAIRYLGPGKSAALYESVRIGAEFIKRVEVNVQGVRWR
ncbi:MAG: hypothetical protein Kow0099_06860 [Candidatus Abyssubacteria bacterium]